MPPLASVRFSITEDDVVALNTRVMLKSPLREATFQRNRRAGIRVGCAILIVLGAVAFLTAPTQRLGLIRAGAWAACYAVFWPMYFVRHLTRSAFDQKMLRITERLVRTRKVPFILGPVEVQLQPDRLVIVDDDGESAQPWTAAESVALEAGDVFIEFADGSMFRVPGRAFEGDSQRTDFMAAARALISRA